MTTYKPHYHPKFGSNPRPLQKMWQMPQCDLSECDKSAKWYVHCDIQHVKAFLDAKSEVQYYYGLVRTHCGRDIRDAKKAWHNCANATNLWLCNEHKNELTECGCLFGYYFQIKDYPTGDNSQFSNSVKDAWR